MHLLKWATNRKYRVFAKKIRDVEVTLWELDFKVAKSRQIREGVRLDRDRAVESLGHTKKALEAAKTPDEKKGLEEQAKALEENAKRYEAQMRMIDEQIYGVAAQGEDPGREGIMDHLKALAELKEMYKSYLKQI